MIPGGLLNKGIYHLRFWAGIPSSGYLVPPLDIGSFAVVGIGNQGTAFEAENWPGVLCPKLDWRIEERESIDAASMV
jgi:hypothetical protein